MTLLAKTLLKSSSFEPDVCTESASTYPPYIYRALCVYCHGIARAKRVRAPWSERSEDAAREACPADVKHLRILLQGRRMALKW